MSGTPSDVAVDEPETDILDTVDEGPEDDGFFHLKTKNGETIKLVRIEKAKDIIRMMNLLQSRAATIGQLHDKIDKMGTDGEIEEDLSDRMTSLNSQMFMSSVKLLDDAVQLAAKYSVDKLDQDIIRSSFAGILDMLKDVELENEEDDEYDPEEDGPRVEKEPVKDENPMLPDQMLEYLTWHVPSEEETKNS